MVSTRLAVLGKLVVTAETDEEIISFGVEDATCELDSTLACVEVSVVVVDAASVEIGPIVVVVVEVDGL